MIDLDISNYHGTYSHLNGQTTIDVKPIDLARAMVTIGQGSWSEVARLGIFRIGELICKALAFSEIENGNLILKNRFYNLNQSEKATISYYFGQGLTKLYSEDKFNIPWLFHVDDYDKLIQYNKKGISNSKIIVGKASKNADRPDLIGIKPNNQSHIFEAKGNSGGYNKSVMQHAINQVSQIKSYNGVAPDTRTACYFDLSTNPINGIIIDPENDENGIDIKLNNEDALNQYYMPFREYKSLFNTRFEINGYEFRTTPIGVPNIFFGFDSRILKEKTKTILNEGLYPDISEIRKSNLNQELDFSLGLDGMIILNRKGNC